VAGNIGVDERWSQQGGGSRAGGCVGGAGADGSGEDGSGGGSAVK
jgi:hypothetical protein